MEQKQNIKQHIMEITTNLINQYDGDTKKITSRLIAEKAHIGLGLINYHFGTKEKLITVCVQNIIKNVIADFNVKKSYNTDQERLTAWASHVFNFLFEHPAISRISILNDCQNYTTDCNSVLTQNGFLQALTDEIADENKQMLSFILTASMQIAFLGSESVKTLLGYDFTQENDRYAYIKKLVAMLFEENRKESHHE